MSEQHKWHWRDEDQAISGELWLRVGRNSLGCWLIEVGTGDIISRRTVPYLFHGKRPTREQAEAVANRMLDALKAALEEARGVS